MPESLSVRFSLCCSREGCRKRVLPKSVLFDGRRVYFRVVILLTIALREQRPRGMTMRQLQTQTGADVKTIRRWQREYRREIESGRYRLLRGRFFHGLEPGLELSGLVSFFVTQNDSESGVVRLLRFVAENEHLDPGSAKSPQKMGSIQNQNGGV